MLCLPTSTLLLPHGWEWIVMHFDGTTLMQPTGLAAGPTLVLYAAHSIMQDFSLQHAARIVRFASCDHKLYASELSVLPSPHAVAQ